MLEEGKRRRCVFVCFCVYLVVCLSVYVCVFDNIDREIDSKILNLV